MAQGIFNLKQVVQAIQQGGWSAQKTPAVEYLVVAGGGGGSYLGGGGGAGGLLQGLDPVPNGQTLLVTVGSGGAGGTGGGAGVIGVNSVFGQISAIGGGRGGAYASTVGGDGGSGGGGNNFETGNANGPGQGTFGQGNAGGRGTVPNGANYQGGGGGGAGTVGAVGNYGNGGFGAASAITGTTTTYAGGGGGSADTGGVAGLGGAGGGGAGGASRGASGGTGTINGANGTANTGGGGGAYGVSGTGGTGGSGIVVVSYPDVYAAATTTTGSPTVSTSGSGSILFNGSSYLTYDGQSSFAFSTGDFTIECWIYFSSFAVTPIVYDSRPTGSNGAYPTIYFNTAGLPQYFTNNTAVISGSALSLNTWYHFAVSRSGTVTKMFVNGTQVGSSYTDTTNYLNGSARPSIATNGAGLGGNPFSGYISNLRIVKGTALYTTTFTPSTVPLTPVTNTQLLLNSVSGAYLADSSTNSFAATTGGTPAWNALSPFTGTGYKNRVYTWTSSGSITF
jgi:hypothetical protein